MYSISRWCGRFGNNIQQISNGIFYSKENSLTFLSPDNDLINSFIVKFGEQYAPPRLYFFHVPSSIGDGLPDFTVDVNKLTKERRMICRDIIYNFLKIDFSNVVDLGDDTVVLHIRSGDIFSKRNHYCPVISNYIQNPLNRSRVTNLPILPTNYRVDLRSNSNINYSNLFDEVGCVYDGAAIGQYLGGIDTRDNPRDTVGFINETTVFDVSELNYIWENGEPFIQTGDDKVKICNLHIHSKDLKKFII